MKKYNLLTENDILPNHMYFVLARSLSDGEVTFTTLFYGDKGWHNKNSEIVCVLDEDVISVLTTQKPGRALEIIEGGFIEDEQYNDLIQNYSSSTQLKLQKWCKKYKKEMGKRTEQVNGLSLAAAEAQDKIMLKRARYIVMRNDGAVFCGLARSYQFKLMDDLGDTAIKTYLSDKKAKSSFLSSWENAESEDFDTGKYRVMKVYEVLVNGTD
jgi:hypothetical protein